MSAPWSSMMQQNRPYDSPSPGPSRDHGYSAIPTQDDRAGAGGIHHGPQGVPSWAAGSYAQQPPYSGNAVGLTPSGPRVHSDMPQVSERPGPTAMQYSNASGPGLFGVPPEAARGASWETPQSRQGFNSRADSPGFNSGADSPGGGYSRAHSPPPQQPYQAAPAQTYYNEGDPRARPTPNWQADSQDMQNGYPDGHANGYSTRTDAWPSNGSNGYERAAVAQQAQLSSYNPRTEYDVMQAQTRLLSLLRDVFAPQDINADLINMQKGPFKSAMLNDMLVTCGFDNRSPQEMEKRTLNSEIKHLHRRRAAASELLDEVEKEVMQIEKILEDRKSRRTRLMKAIGYSGFTQMCCGPCLDDDEREEVNRGLYMHGGQVEIRSRLKERLEESELLLAERDKELRDLRNEFGTVEGQRAQLSGRNHKMLASVKEIRQRILRRYAAAFDSSFEALLRTSFVAWQQLVRNAKHADQVLKKGALAFSMGFGKGPYELAFACWHQYVKEVRARKQEKDTFIKEKYAARFLKSAASASLHAMFIDWHKVVVERKMFDREQQAREEAAADMHDRLAIHMNAANEGTTATCKVTIIAARNLRNADWFGRKSDPYCLCEIHGKSKSKFQTPVVKSNLNPTWNFTHDVVDFAVGDELKFSIWDKDMMKSDQLGHCTLKARQFYPQGFGGWLELDDGKQHQQGHAPQLQVKVEIKTVRRPSRELGGPRTGAEEQLAAALQAAQAAKEAADAAKEAADRAQSRKEPKQCMGCSIA